VRKHQPRRGFDAKQRSVTHLTARQAHDPRTAPYDAMITEARDDPEHRPAFGQAANVDVLLDALQPG